MADGETAGKNDCSTTTTQAKSPPKKVLKLKKGVDRSMKNIKCSTELSLKEVDLRELKDIMELNDDQLTKLKNYLPKKFACIDSVKEEIKEVIEDKLEKEEEWLEKEEEWLEKMLEKEEEWLEKMLKKEEEWLEKMLEKERILQKEKDEKKEEHEKFVKAWALMSLRLHIEQLTREFKEGSKQPLESQMIIDLEGIGEKIEFTGVSFFYIQWTWFLRCSNYNPAKLLAQYVKARFDKISDFVELISHMYGECSGDIHHPLEPLTFKDIKKGLELQGMDSDRMFNAIDVLEKLKKSSPRKHRKKSRKPSPTEVVVTKKVRLDRSKFISTDSDSCSK